MRHFGFDTSRLFTCVVRLCTQKARSSETKIANPKQVTYCFPVPYWFVILMSVKSHMAQYILVETLAVFQPDEIDDFQLFVVSPLFLKHIKNHKHEDLRVLLAYAIVCLKENQLFDKSQAFSLVFGDRTYSESTINSLMSHLMKLVHQFIHLRQSNYRGAPEIQLSVATFYRERNLESKFVNAIEQLQKENEAVVVRDKEQLFFSYLTEYENYRFQSFYNHRINDVNLLKTIQYLDQYYAVAKLELATSLLTQSKVTALDVAEIIPMAIITELLDESPLTVFPLAEAFKLSHHLIARAESGDHYFQQLRQLLREKSDELPLSHIKMFCAFLRNYCTSRYNRGSDTYLSELFSLYQEHLAEGYLFENGGLMPAIINNIVRVGLKLKSYDWIAQFLLNRSYPIIGTHQPDALYNFYLAQYHFSVGQFEKSEELLLGESTETYYQLFKDERLVIEALQLELKIYFETRQTEDFLQDKLKAFRIKVVRKGEKTLVPHYVEAVLNFVKMFKKLLLYRSKIDITARNKMLQVIEQIRQTNHELPTPLVEKEWIEDKFNQMSQQ